MKDENDINNLLLSETDGATPADHLEALASMRKDAERHQFVRLLSSMPDEERERYLQMAEDRDEAPESYDAWCDACILVYRSVLPPKD